MCPKPNCIATSTGRSWPPTAPALQPSCAPDNFPLQDRRNFRPSLTNSAFNHPHLLQHLVRGAEGVDGAADVAFDFGSATEGGQHRKGQQAAGFQVQPFTAPGCAPDVAGDEFLQRGGKGVHIAEILVDEGLAHHSLAHLQALLELFIAIHLVSPESAADSSLIRPRSGTPEATTGGSGYLCRVCC